MSRIYLKIFMVLFAISLVISIVTSKSDLSNFVDTFAYTSFVVFTAIINFTFFIRYEVADLVSARFNEPGIKEFFPTVIAFLALTSILSIPAWRLYVG
ncbi:hypothetical protein [Thalassotalea ganghwensis]